VDEGAFEGNPDDYQAPDIPEPPSLSRVDLTLTIPEAYTPTEAPDDYRCFLLDWPQTELSYVTGFTAAPDDARMVHHMIAFAIPPGQVAQYEALDDAEPGIGYTCFGGPGGPITSVESAGTWLGAWAPGGVAGDLPEGTGIPMEPGSRVVLQVHYNTLAGEVGPDQSSVEFKLDDQVDKPAFMMLWANPDWLFGDMPIPAGAPSTVHAFELDPTLFMDFLTDLIPPNEPFQIYAATAHMHTLGTRAEQTIQRADGSQTCLLSIPQWDFNWQQRYRFEEPVVFNPGDTLRSECEWNNEANDQNVNWGDGTGDEMCLAVFYATAL
ncbi:MAG: monooxygenase, partial [Deltaproteobacteria bacterium]|nr:monooxygenase [Deltaproteobacteria bacterium]